MFGGGMQRTRRLIEDTQRHGYISAESKQAAANSTEVRLLMLAWKIAVVGCVVAMAAWFALAIVAPSWRHVPLAIAALFASVGVVFPFYAIWRMPR